MTQAYKKAMRLYFKFQEVEEYAPECSAYPMFIEGHEPEMDDQTTGTTVERDISDVMLERTNEPIAVTWNMGEGKPVKWEPFTVGAFLKLNPAKAIEKGGGFKHLVDSGATKKAPKTPGKAEKPEGLTIKTTDTGLGVVAELHRYMAEILSAKDKAEYGKLAQALMAKDTDETCTAMVELKNWLNDLCRDCKLDGRYVKLKQSGSDLIQDAA